MMTMFKRQNLWIIGAGIGLALYVLLAGLLWGLIARLLKLSEQQMRARIASEARQAQPAATGQAEAGQAEAGQAEAGAQAADLPPDMLAAVMVAVRMHRRIRRKQAAPAMRTHQPGTLPSRWIGAGRASQNLSWHPRRR